MREFKHTPGPWEAAAASGYGSPRTLFIRRVEDDVSIADNIIDPETDKPSEANARLLAAAPDLLEALQNCIAALFFEKDEARRIAVGAAADILVTKIEKGGEV